MGSSRHIVHEISALFVEIFIQWLVLQRQLDIQKGTHQSTVLEMVSRRGLTSPQFWKRLAEGDLPVHSFEMGSNRGSHEIYVIFFVNYAGQL